MNMEEIKRHILLSLRRAGVPLSIHDIYEFPTESHYIALKQLSRDDVIEVVCQGKYQVR